ncbi:MAG: hypothetical protein RBQ97_06475 [Acholeplasma sp.]|nr:hypothetical protein [Acholeplasma sp.]
MSVIDGSSVNYDSLSHDNSPNNSNPTLLRLIPKTSVYVFVSIIVPILWVFYAAKPVTHFFLNLLTSVYFLQDALPFIKMIVPLVLLTVIAFILWSYLISVPDILDLIHIDPREEWMDYITYKGLKIKFYRLITFFKSAGKSIFSISYYSESKILDGIVFSGFQVLALIYLLIFGFIIFFIYTSYAGEEFLGVNVLESQNLTNYINANWKSFEFNIALYFNIFISLITTLGIVMVLLSTMDMIPTLFLKYFFSSKRGYVDASDVPIFFTKMAMQELETVDFSGGFDQVQDIKNKISNLINNSLRFVKVDEEKTYIDYMNFCSPKSRGLINKNVIGDIKFRLNGLSEMMNKTLINVNHMSCLEDKNEIIKDLEMYLKIIENKDLSKIKPIELATKESTIDKSIKFFFHNMFLPIIIVILTQMLI